MTFTNPRYLYPIGLALLNGSHLFDLLKIKQLLRPLRKMYIKSQSSKNEWDENAAL